MKQLSEKYQKIWDECQQKLFEDKLNEFKDNDGEVQPIEGGMAYRHACDQVLFEFLERVIPEAIDYGDNYQDPDPTDAHKEFLSTVLTDKP